MFITRKELDTLWEKIAELSGEITDMKDSLEAKSKSLDSLAKELGYEWTSEAVKVREELYTDIYSSEERAVLKWSWKKINSKSK